MPSPKRSPRRGRTSRSSAARWRCRRRAGVNVLNVTTAREMLDAAFDALPADIFVGAAAVTDWRAEHPYPGKRKKSPRERKLHLEFVPTGRRAGRYREPSPPPGAGDRLRGGDGEAFRARGRQAPCQARRLGARQFGRRGAVFGAGDNEVLFITEGGEKQWERMSKRDVADRLVQEIAAYFNSSPQGEG